MLGYKLDGIPHTIQLPTAKLEALLKEVQPEGLAEAACPTQMLSIPCRMAATCGMDPTFHKSLLHANE
jgi:hypothetical protein